MSNKKDKELTTPPGSRFAYDTESGFIYDTLKNEWITEMIEASDLLNQYADREKKCATMDEAEKVALIRALQEISDALGFLGGEHSPREIVERVKLLSENNEMYNVETKRGTSGGTELIQSSSSTHCDLVKRAGRWLKSLGCSAILEEMTAYTYNGETPDAIGWKSNQSIVVEVKVSRADFLKDQKKRFRGERIKGMGSWRFYLVPQGLLKPEDCPEGWGVYEVRGCKVCHFAGVDYRNAAQPPFIPCLRSERAMLVSAVRRLSNTK